MDWPPYAFPQPRTLAAFSVDRLSLKYGQKIALCP
jgi:hypothetical protein